MEGANNYKMEDGIEQADQGPGLEETFVIVHARVSDLQPCGPKWHPLATYGSLNLD